MQLKVNPENENEIQRDPDAVKRTLVSARNENPNENFSRGVFIGNNYVGGYDPRGGFSDGNFAGGNNSQGSGSFGAPDPFGPSTGRNPFENDELGPVSPKPPTGPVVYDHKKNLNPAFIVVPIIAVIFLIVVLQTVRGMMRKNYTPGTVSGNTYTNEYFDFKATFDSKYTLEGGYYDKDTVQRSLEHGMSVNELRAYYDIAAEALSIEVYPLDYYYDGPSSEVKDDMERYKDEYSKELSANGYIVSDIEQDTMTIAGKTQSGYLIDGKLEGGGAMTMSMAQFFIYKGNYCCVITAASTSKGKAKLLISNNFSELD